MPAEHPRPRPGALRDVALEFLRLGLTSFGGPVAHLGYFRQTFVERRKWLDEAEYADLVALCQFLPGPASSQVGIGIGFRQAGYPGALAAWVGFTAPSVVLLLAFAYGIGQFHDLVGSGLLHGLKIAALAVVALAVWNMAKNLAPDRPRRAIAVLAAVAVLLIPNSLAQIAVLGLAGLWGIVRHKDAAPAAPPAEEIRLGNRAVARLLLALFVALLIVLPLLAAATGDPALRVADQFYRAGALVFGGGHLVLPLLQAQLVPDFLSRDTFLAGYGAAQAVPGPLFSFAAFAGAELDRPPNGLPGALLALGAIYLPSFLLVLGALPFWTRLRRNARLRSGLDAANAAVVGLLIAALYDPVFVAAVEKPRDLAVTLLALAALALLRLPPWLVVVLSAAAGYGLSLIP
ncbi:MAG: chromate efflux transporter [Devosia sp.]